MTTKDARKGKGAFFWLAIIALALVVAAAIGSQREAAQHTNDAAPRKVEAPQLMADIRLGKVDAYGFQQLCGPPSMRVNQKDYFSLFYTDQNIVVMFRHRTLGTMKAEARRPYPFAKFDGASFWEINPRHMLAPEAALEALHCKTIQQTNG